MDRKSLPIGIDDFKKLIQDGYYYIDKTLLIKELLDKKGEVNLFTRPRRFGKTLNMSMLRYYFDISENNQQELFSESEIMKQDESYLSHMGKYPVISISLKPLKQTTFDMASTQDNLWNFLFFTGYLKKINEQMQDEILYMEMGIPNSEVRYIYKTTVLRWFDEQIKQRDLNPLYQGMIAGDGDIVQKEISLRLRECISFYDNKEAFYHGFLLGLLGGMDEYLVDSNRESGDGRYDICIRSLDVEKPAIVIEMKQAENYPELENKSQQALEQIQMKYYDEHLINEGYREIIEYGIAFYKKNCRVKTSRLLL